MVWLLDWVPLKSAHLAHIPRAEACANYKNKRCFEESGWFIDQKTGASCSLAQPWLTRKGYGQATASGRNKRRGGHHPRALPHDPSALSMPPGLCADSQRLARGETLVACTSAPTLAVAVVADGAIRTTRDARRFMMWRCSSTCSWQHWRALWRHHGAACGVSAVGCRLLPPQPVCTTAPATTDADNDNKHRGPAKRAVAKARAWPMVRLQGDGIALSWLMCPQACPYRSL